MSVFCLVGLCSSVGTDLKVEELKRLIDVLEIEALMRCETEVVVDEDEKIYLTCRESS